MKDANYVSEYAIFISQYLAKHPEVLEDQKRGWNIWWDRKADFDAIKQAEEDSVPDDSYGDHPVDLRIESPPMKASRKPKVG